MQDGIGLYYNNREFIVNIVVKRILRNLSNFIHPFLLICYPADFEIFQYSHGQMDLFCEIFTLTLLMCILNYILFVAYAG